MLSNLMLVVGLCATCGLSALGTSPKIKNLDLSGAGGDAYPNYTGTFTQLNISAPNNNFYSATQHFSLDNSNGFDIVSSRTSVNMRGSYYIDEDYDYLKKDYYFDTHETDFYGYATNDIVSVYPGYQLGLFFLEDSWAWLNDYDDEVNYKYVSVTPFINYDSIVDKGEFSYPNSRVLLLNIWFTYRIDDVDLNNIGYYVMNDVYYGSAYDPVSDLSYGFTDDENGIYISNPSSLMGYSSSGSYVTVHCVAPYCELTYNNSGNFNRHSSVYENLSTYYFKLPFNTPIVPTQIQMSLTFDYLEVDEILYETGYSDGYKAGYSSGLENADVHAYQTGYDNGYRDGTSHGTWFGLFSAVADTPVLMIRNLFNFELFGMNVLVVALSLLTGIIVLGLFRKFF